MVERVVNPVGPTNAKIMLVGEAPGREEEETGFPFVGASGTELTKMLAEAGIDRGECYITNVIKVRPPNNNIEYFISKKKGTAKSLSLSHELNGRFLSSEALLSIRGLREEIEKVRPNVIVTLGDTAMWALTGKSGITNWRGSILEYVMDDNSVCKIIPTYHPAAVLRMWEWRSTTVQDFRRVKVEANFKEIRYPGYNFKVRPSFEEAKNWLEGYLTHLQSRPLHAGPIQLAVDIETRLGHIACLALAHSHVRAISIPFMCVENPEGYWSEREEQIIVQLLKQILTHPEVEVIGQNFLYDSQYIARHWGFIPNVAFDTMIAQHVCFPGLPKSLHFISSMYLEYHQFWKEDGKLWDPKTMPEEQFWAYNCRDAVVTFAAARELERTIQAMHLQSVFDFQMSLFMPVLKMMLRGVRIDHKLREELAITLHDERHKRQIFINTAIGKDINIRSTKQLQEFFYNELGLEPIHSRKPNAEGIRPVTTDDEALIKIGQRELLLQPIVKCISEMRSIGVYYSTFVQADYDTDRRLRCSFNPAGTTTFRFNSSTDAFGYGMNLQNIPAEDKETKEKEKRNDFVLPNIRKLFIPDPDHIIMDWDLDRADLQVVVWEAEDEELKRLLREGLDLHLANAQVLFNLPYSIDDLRDPKLLKTIKERFEAQRHLAKTFVHGTNYGGSARTMAINCSTPRIRLSVSESEEMQSRWFNKHPGIKMWHLKVQNCLYRDRTVSNAFGYQRTFFERIESVFPDALAWIPQSTVACVINRGLKNIDDYLPNVKLLLQVHDSLVMQAPRDDVLRGDTIAKIKAQMRIVVPYKDPLVIPTNCKLSDRSWGDCKPPEQLKAA